MPGPRADFECARCQETYELPVAAAACPLCQGPITRLYNQVQVAEGTAKFVDRLLEPAQVQRQNLQNARREVQRAGGIRMVEPGVAIGAVGADGRQASRAISVPILRSLRGPVPK